ncbi:MAG: radical SAM protein [Methanobrevibacter sp.]|nr:radical SAM protein [Methanobrevibacter sp.]
MNISGENIEALRTQLNFTTRDFCDELEIDINDYALFIRENDFNQFPANAANKLTSIMLGEERKNLLAYKDKFPKETEGYFANIKILKHLEKLSKLEKSPDEVGPITVEFHPTNICNHACNACTFGISNIGKDKKNTFDIELLDDLITDLKKLEVKGIDITGGGDPLCHKEIDKIISSFAESFNVGLVTNGYELNKENDLERKKELRKTILSSCTWCRISVDAGSQEVYSIMHGDKPHIKFNDIVKKIEILAKEKIAMESETTLGISFLLTPYNFLDLIKSISIFREIKGIDYFQVKPIVISPFERSKEGIIFWDKRLFELLTVIKSYETESFKIFTLSYKFSDMLLSEDSGLPFTKCWGHPFYPTIAADGSILVCCHMLLNLLDNKKIGVYGKISKNEGFYELWNRHSRFEEGDNIHVRLCPCNCKLSETNKVLENFYGQKIMHKNFIN